MNRLIVADAGPLIALARADSIGLLAALHRSVLVPQAVEREILRQPDKPGVAQIERAFASGGLERQPVDVALSGRRIGTLGDGESAAIELAEALDALLLIDERRGREVATERGLHVIGTLAVLITAHRQGLVAALGPLLGRIREGGYFISDALVAAALASVGESPEGLKPAAPGPAVE